MNKTTSQGTIALIAAFSLLFILGFTGLALDFGYAWLQKTRLQNTADAEALACVINASSAPCGQSAGDIDPQLNPFAYTVSLSNPGDSTLCPLPQNQNYCAKSTVSATWNTFFIHFFGVPTLTVSVNAIAGKTNSIGSCIITTSSFSANGTNQVQLNNCSASIGGTLSSTNKSGITITGLGNITVFNGNSPNQCGSCTPAPVSTQSAIPAMPSNAIPTRNLNGSLLPTLSYTTCTNSSCVPAIYTGGEVTLKSSTVLTSGNYVFNGGFSTGGNTLTSGTGGVALYIPGTQPLDLSGTVNLTAPSVNGCSAGSAIVVSHPYASGYNGLTLNGSKNQLTLNGVVNLSADDITVNGASAGLTITGSLVTHSITLHGNMYPHISSNPCFNLYEIGGTVVLVN